MLILWAEMCPKFKRRHTFFHGHFLRFFHGKLRFFTGGESQIYTGGNLLFFTGKNTVKKIIEVTPVDHPGLTVQN